MSTTSHDKRSAAPRRHRHLNVRDLCTRDPVTVMRDDSIVDCARRMHERHVGSVVVVERRMGAEVPIGMITDRDIAIEVVAFGLDPATLTAADVMSTPDATVKLDADLMEALSIMREQGIRRLIVVKRDGELAGVLAIDDLQQAFAEELDGLSSVMRAELQRERATRGGPV